MNDHPISQGMDVQRYSKAKFAMLCCTFTLAVYCAIRTIPEMIGRFGLFVFEYHFRRDVNHVYDQYFRDTFNCLILGFFLMSFSAILAWNLKLKRKRWFLYAVLIILCFLVLLGLMQPIGILIKYSDYLSKPSR